MPTVTIQCNYCGHEMDCPGGDIDDFVSRCTECNNDVCDHCGDVDERIHPQCAEDAGGEE